MTTVCLLYVCCVKIIIKKRTKAPGTVSASDAIRAQKEAESAKIRMEMIKKLQHISEARRLIVSGNASGKQLHSAVNDSINLVIDSTNRMIRLSAQV